MRKDSFRRYKGGVLVAFWNLSIDFEMMVCYMADWLVFVAVAEPIDMGNMQRSVGGRKRARDCCVTN